MAVYVFALRRPIKVPAPTNEILPLGGKSFEELRRRWQSCCDEWRRLFEDSALDRKRALFTHPLGGWFNLDQTGRFVIEHIRHHAFQLTRIEGTIKVGQSDHPQDESFARSD